MSKEFTLEPENKAVVIGDREIIALMINEEDHLRLQVLQFGFNLQDAWAVLTQVNVAYLGYRLNFRNYRLARRLADVNDRILNQVQAGEEAGTTDSLTEIESRAVTILAQVQSAMAYAELQQSFGRPAPYRSPV